MDRTQPEGECLVWTGGRTTAGYARLSVAGKPQYVHRLVWAQHHGPIPDGLVIMHTCDNPPCVNIDHLRMGTDADNAADRDAKGRGRGGSPRPNVDLCRNGLHPWPESAVTYPSARGPHCQPCAREANRLRMRKERAKAGV